MLFNIQRWSLHDGPGIRTTVFFKGCPLRCRWCANPESWSFANDLLFFREKCTGCGACIDACPEQANRLSERGIELDRKKCTGCGSCINACPSEARELAGLNLSPDEVLKTLLKDAVFYRASGGGVTFSGGEPFAQVRLLEQLAKSCTMAGIPTAVETSGYFSMKEADRALGWITDLFVDVKHTDDEIHKSLTGVSNQPIIGNIFRLDKMGRALTIRVPLVKGLNDTAANIQGIIDLCGRLNNLAGIELLSYHDLGSGKYDALGLPYDHGMQAPANDEVERIKDRILAKGLRTT